MRKVYAIGDCVLDVFFEDNKPVEAKPGGSFLNSSVSLGRLGVNVSLISELGEDRVGEQILHFLRENNVGTETISIFSDANSNLALAFLNEEKNADYSFYKTRKGLETCIRFPNRINKGDIVLFGSFLAVKKEFRPALTSFLNYCHSKEAIIIYDPNFRAQHLALLDEVLPYIKENIAIADVVKASDEDIKLICGVKNIKEAKLWMRDFSDALLIYTANKNDVSVYADREYAYCVPSISPVSTVGAGDTFNAAIAYFFIRESIYNVDVNLSADIICELVKIAVLFSQEVCMGYDNFLSKEFVANYRI